ncbi:WD repeat-containing protein 4 [Gaertneriomyces sp. JEL0708]|nr:WD repeat-containing protein 4 [Gaertneriomyces sp. JEL0708]
MATDESAATAAAAASVTLPYHQILHLERNELDALVIASGNIFVVVDARTGNLLAAPAFLETAAPIQMPSDSFPEGQIRCLAFSPAHNLLAVATDSKHLTFYDASSWDKKGSRVSIKRANCVTFTTDDKVLIGDKFGDVYSFSITDDKADQPLILGHVSMILDMAVSKDGRWVLTADRDEKVRVSRYPHAYDIQAFCLGHTSYVSKIHIPDFAPDVLISGGGDSFLVVWNYLDGQNVQQVEFSSPGPVIGIVSHAESRIVAVALEGESFVLIYDASDIKAIKETQRVSIPSEALSLAFDKTGTLFIPTLESGVIALSPDDKKVFHVNTASPVLSTFSAIRSITAEALPDFHTTSKLRKVVLPPYPNKREYDELHRPKNGNQGKGTKTRGGKKQREKLELKESEAGEKRKSTDEGVSEDSTKKLKHNSE